MKTAYQNLWDFVSELEHQGELLRIKQEVSSELEITEITDRMSKSPEGGKALLFENVKGSDFPVLTNAYGSTRRINLALGSENLDDLAERIKGFLHMAPPKTLRDKLKLLPMALEVSRFLPRTRKMSKPPCQEVVHIGDEVDLTKIPVLKCWPDDGGPFVTLPVVFSKDPTTGGRNVGMYRLQIFDRNTTGMHWHIHKDGAHFYHEYCKQNRRMEVAVAIGTDPAVTYAATAPMPRGIDEMLLAGFIRRKPVTMVKGKTVDIEVPAEAEFIIEGYVVPGEMRNEGPFGDHTGYYSLEDDYPVLHVTAITHRLNPIYFATVVGRPPMEDCYLALATERIFLPMLQTVLPEVKDYCLPWEGVFHNIVVTAIEKEFPQHARKIMDGMWGTGQMSFAKTIITVDDNLLFNRPAELLRQILDTIDLVQDLIVSSGVLDVLDHSAPQPLYGSKLGVDASRRITGEQKRSGQTPRTDGSQLFSALQQLENGFVAHATCFADTRNPVQLFGITKDDRRNSAHYMALTEQQIGNSGICILFDHDIDLNDGSLCLWKIFNNTDPGRDITIRGQNAVIDATRKNPADGHHRQWPDDIVMDTRVKTRVAEILKIIGLASPE